MSSKLEEICTICHRLCLLHETNLKKYAKTIMQNTTTMIKLSQTILVRIYSFADIMTRDKFVAFKIVSCSRTGYFYKASKIHSDIFNTFVDIVQQKLSTLSDFDQTSTP